MQYKINILLIIVAMARLTGGYGNGPAPVEKSVTRTTGRKVLRDTLYVFLKSDGNKNNHVDWIDFSTYIFSGFIRSGIPRDYLDSNGYTFVRIGLEKDTLAVVSDPGRRKVLDSRMISLYDFKDSLKASLDPRFIKKYRGIHLEPGFLDDPPRVVLVVLQKGDVYYLRRVTRLSYFFRPTD